MATYSQVRRGAQGEAVSELQRLLNKNGYTLDVDGKFGSNTLAAVRDYQTKNNLTVDGIVGNQTWSSLFGTGGNASASMVGYSPDGGSSSGGGSYGNRPTYSRSSELDELKKRLDEYEASKPGDYQSQYGDQIQAMLDKILNREDFSYDFNADPLYQQYADRYQQQGQLAMMDTMGNAAALSGGYGNSYGQTVGQQTYQGYMQELNDVIPELRNSAYQMYQDEGNKMLSDVSLLQGMDESDYNRYRDDISDYYTDLNYYYTQYSDMSDDEYNRYLHDVDAWENDRAYWYTRQQDDRAQSNWEREFQLAQQQASRSSGNGSGDGSGNNSKSPADWDKYFTLIPREQIRSILFNDKHDARSAEIQQELIDEIGMEGLAKLRSKYSAVRG